MSWFLHSWCAGTRRVSRRGPFETEALALIAACGDFRLDRKPLLVEGPDGVKVEGAQLSGFVAAQHEQEKKRRQAR